MKTSRLIGILLAVAVLFPSLAYPLHNQIGRTRCLDCHMTLPFNPDKLSFYADIAEVCRGCHKRDHASSLLSHPVGVFPSMKIPEDMPLARSGQLTCITCHTFHANWRPVVEDNPYLLRRPKGKLFCYSCHRKL